MNWSVLVRESAVWHGVGSVPTGIRRNRSRTKSVPEHYNPYSTFADSP